jgi:2-polyprenyl-3-methyl-5-hydroxy-6-metoxy-1,4-benzoquinol methylase
MPPMTAAAPFRLETCACPLCGEPSPEHARAAFPPYRVVDCASCSMRYLSPRVHASDVARLYGSEDYWEKGGSEGGYSSYSSMEPLLVRTFVRRLSLLPPRKAGARLLDVGCGPGAGLAAALSLGYEAWGLDVSSTAVAVASSRHPARVRLGTLSDRLFPRGSFDVITLFDVIEHVYDPRRLAVDLAWHLVPEGRLVVATPNVKSLLARVMGRRWVSYKIPEHVSYFSPRTLAAALAPDFEIERVSSCGQYVSLDFLLSRIGDALPVGGRLLHATSRLFRPGRAALYANSGSMLVTARRSPAP